MTTTNLAAASTDPQRLLHAIAIFMTGIGAAVAIVVFALIGFKVLAGGARGSSGDSRGSGLRGALESAGSVLVGLFFIFGGTFLVGICLFIVSALQK